MKGKLGKKWKDNCAVFNSWILVLSQTAQDFCNTRFLMHCVTFTVKNEKKWKPNWKFEIDPTANSYFNIFHATTNSNSTKSDLIANGSRGCQ